jgi:glycosyltransferase involved in cell wall biosynthesis
MESVLAPLSRAFEVVLFAVDHHGAAAWDERGFEVRGNAVAGDAYGYEQLPGLLEEIRPDVVLLHRDSNFFPMHRSTLASYRERRPDARVVVYCPLDWSRVRPSLAAADLLVLYTQSALAVAERAFTEAYVPAPATAVIPHGVDREQFAPLVPGDRAASRAEARRRLFPDEPELDEAFVVLNANRNQKRKRVDLTLRGFALFARGRPDARLYLHMGMRDLGWDVPRLAAELGIGDRLLVTTDSPDRPQVPDEHLNLIYNACDVGINTATAEGWGLVSFEHAAAGAAQVVPDHGACAELWRDRALLVPATRDERGRHVVSAEGVAFALERLHEDAVLRADLADRAHAFATSDAFSWAAIAERWEDALLGCLLAQPPVAAAVR